MEADLHRTIFTRSDVHVAILRVVDLRGKLCITNFQSPLYLCLSSLTEVIIAECWSLASEETKHWKVLALYKRTETERERETERDRQTETERERQTERDRDRERKRDRERQRQRQRDIDRDRLTDREQQGKV